GSPLDHQVVGPAETQVLLHGGQIHLGKFFPHHGHGAVHRIVVDHENLHVEPVHGAENAVETLFQKVGDVVIDDDYREVGHACLLEGTVVGRAVQDGAAQSDFVGVAQFVAHRYSARQGGDFQPFERRQLFEKVERGGISFHGGR